MGNYEQLKQAVSEVIKTNGNEEITGDLLKEVLLSIISSVGYNMQFGGFADVNTNPSGKDQKLFYITNNAGVYTGFSSLTVKKDEIVIFYTDSFGNWNKRIVWAKTPFNVIVPTYDALLRAKSIVSIDFFANNFSINYGLSVLGFFNGQVIIAFLDNNNNEVLRFSQNTSTQPTGVKKYVYSSGEYFFNMLVDWDKFDFNLTDTQGTIKIIPKSIISQEVNLIKSELGTIEDDARIKGLVLTGDKTFLFRKTFPIISCKFWANDITQKYAFTNIVTRVGNQTFFTINNKNTNIEVLRLAVTEDMPTTGVKVYEKYDSINKYAMRVVYDWGKYVPGSGGSDGNMQIEVDAYPYNSQERMMFNNTLLSNDLSFTTVVATRNSKNYNSIRELMDSLPATASNKYRIFVPKGRWCETDIQGKKYVEIIGEDMYETVLYINGNDANIKTPLNYSYPEYSDKPLNQVPQDRKHVVFVRHDTYIRGLTIEADNTKYCIHIDSNLNEHKVDVKDCVLTDKGGINYCVGIGIRGGQELKFNNCKFIRPNTSLNGVYIHNWNNEQKDSLLEIKNSKFIGCGYIYISELGSERNDIVNLINCFSNYNNGQVKIAVEQMPSGTTYWTNPETGNKETDPTKVPYSLKLNCLTSNVGDILWVNFNGFTGNPRPLFINKTISLLNNFGNQ